MIKLKAVNVRPLAAIFITTSHQLPSYDRAWGDVDVVEGGGALRLGRLLEEERKEAQR